MVEYEARYYVEDLQKLKDTLRSLGFKKEKEVFQKDIIFIKEEHIIRVRIEKNGCFLDYKRLLSKREWEELRVKIDDWNTMVKILSRVLPLNKIIIKNREIWTCPTYRAKVMIDNIKALGTFIEIEGEKEDVENLVKILNLKKEAPPYGKLLDKLKEEGKIDYDFERWDVICL